MPAIDIRTSAQRRLTVLQERIGRDSTKVAAMIAERNRLIVKEWIDGTRMGDLSEMLTTEDRPFTVSAVRKVIRERTKEPRQTSFDARRQRGEPVVRRLLVPKSRVGANSAE